MPTYQNIPQEILGMKIAEIPHPVRQKGESIRFCHVVFYRAAEGGGRKDREKLITVADLLEKSIKDLKRIPETGEATWNYVTSIVLPRIFGMKPGSDYLEITGPIPRDKPLGEFFDRNWKVIQSFQEPSVAKERMFVVSDTDIGNLLAFKDISPEVREAIGNLRKNNEIKRG